MGWLHVVADIQATLKDCEMTNVFLQRLGTKEAYVNVGQGGISNCKCVEQLGKGETGDKLPVRPSLFLRGRSPGCSLITLR